jgi:ribosomal protein S18 acetylase RimI-like enzyme
MSEISISDAEDPESVATVRDLFAEYGDWVEVDLSFQKFAEECSSLPVPYVRPAGALLLARSDGRAAGCCAIRPIDRDVCELKRLWVRPEFRGQAVARRLVITLIERARAAGYRGMKLDTLPQMTSATSLYFSLGFKECEPYRFNPVPGSLFLALDLTR